MCRSGDSQDQAEAALARERADCEAKVASIEARMKTVEEENRVLHTQLTSSAESPGAGQGMMRRSDIHLCREHPHYSQLSFAD